MNNGKTFFVTGPFKGKISGRDYSNIYVLDDSRRHGDRLWWVGAICDLCYHYAVTLVCFSCKAGICRKCVWNHDIQSCFVEVLSSDNHE